MHACKPECVCLQFDCTLLCVSPLWPLSRIHHQNCLLCIHVKAIDPFPLLVPPLINICPGQCMWTRSWNQETRPFNVFYLPVWSSHNTLEKHTNWRLRSHMGYLGWRNARVTQSSLPDLQRRLAYKWLVYLLRCCSSHYWYLCVA